MLKIFYGRENIDKEAFMYERIKVTISEVRRGSFACERIILLVPDQYTLQAERAAMQEMQVPGFVEFEITSLSQLRRRVLSETGGDRRPHINKDGRHMLLFQLINDVTEELISFANIAPDHAFIDMINNLISEMKQFNTSPDDVLRAAEGTDDSVLAGKLTDIYKIYKRYEDAISEKYTDTEDVLTLFLEKAGQSTFLKKTEIWMYGFDYLTPKDMNIVTRLTEICSGVNIVLTMDEEPGRCENKSRDHSLFRITREISQKLANQVVELGIRCEFQQVKEKRYARLNDSVSAHIEQELYSYPYVKHVREMQNLALVSAANYYGEAESAATEICRLVREENYRYEDILVICNDMEKRAAILKRVFSAYNLPVFLDRKKALLHNPVLEFIVSLLEISVKGWKQEHIFRLLKTGMTSISQKQSELLEEYTTIHKVNSKKKWNEEFSDLDPFRRSPDRADLIERDKALLINVNEARQAVVEIITGFETAIRSSKNVSIRTRAIYEYFVNEIQMPKRIEDEIYRLQAQDDHAYADEMHQVWGAVIGIMDQLVTILGDMDVNAQQYAKLVNAGFESIEIGVLPTNADQLIVGTMQRTRSRKIKALFVLGANDGILPQTGATQSVLNEDEKEALYEADAKFCKLESLQMEEEQLAIYRNFSKADSYIWISYAVSDVDGNELRPSFIFERMHSLFPENQVIKDVLNSSDEMLLISGANSTLQHLTEKLDDLREGRTMQDIWGDALGWFSKNMEERLGPIEDGLQYINKKEKIDIEAVTDLYATGNGAIRVSPSALERYGRCPFSHFVTYGLKPKERRVVEIASRERGDIFHKILMEYSKRLTLEGVAVHDEASPWMIISREESDGLVEQLFREILDEASADSVMVKIFNQGKEEEYRTERIKRIAKSAAWVAAEQVKAGAITKMYFEEPFGERGVFPALQEDISPSMAVKIEGQIDRVDVLKGDFIKVIDYKSGSDKFDLQETLSGWRLQLPLYLRAALQEDGCDNSQSPGGMFYFSVDENRFDSASWNINEDGIKEKIDAEMRKQFKLDGIAVDDQDVLKAIAGEDFDSDHYRKGNSDILPVRVIDDGEEKKLVKYSATSNKILTADEFSEVREKVNEKIHELCTDLAEGVIFVDPKKTKSMTACEYCKYRGICSFDASF